MAVVPTGSFCRTSSSFRDLPSAERQARAQGWPGPSPTATGMPRVGRTGSCTHWGPGGGTGGQGTTADLWGERNVTAQTGRAQGPHSSSHLRQGLCGLCGSRTRQGRAQAEMGCPEISAKAFLPIATRVRRHRQAQRGLSYTGGICAGPGGEMLTGGVPPRGPCPEGPQEAVWLGPGLTTLSEKILDLCDGGMGLHLQEARDTGKSDLGRSPDP